eukprot:TRINITY_DN4154_c0_g2_i1.p1 TRINITY_DN4154_c0_g2~~TRINITY_DN4154_c0_g2_i1.p1  ORF type:complete len:2480 (+),score=936.01 TRINITY_DN4154_c0_g2_i1:61-7500(+)
MPQYAHLVVSFTKIWEDFVEVTWERELADGAVVKRFHLVATADDYKVERLFEAKERRYLLVGLPPGSVVKVGVRAQYDGGDWGAWCSSTATLHASCAVKVGVVGPDSIHGTFTWGAGLESTDLHDWVPAAKFQLRVRQKESVLSAALCDQELTAGQREFKVTGLLPDGIFTVQVRAVSAGGEVGQWSELQRFLTLANIDVRVVEVGADYAVMWWGREGEAVGAPPPSIGSRTSIAQFQYRVELYPTATQMLTAPDTPQAVVDEQTFTGDVCTKKVAHLLPGRIYGIVSRQLNVQGDWSPWATKKFKTIKATAMVDIMSVSDNFLLFSWGQERGEDAPDVDLSVDAKIVNWQVRCVNTVNKEESCVVLPEHETSTRIVNLPHSTEFALSVRAKTTYGVWGPWAEDTYLSTLSPLAVAVDAIGENWLKLDWARKDKAHYDDSVVRYHLQISAAHNPFRVSKYFAADTLSFRFEELSPNTEYLVSIQACVGDRWQPWSEAMPVRTASPAQVHLVRRGEDYLQVRWTSEYYSLNSVDPLDQRYEVKITRTIDGAPQTTTQEFTNVLGYRLSPLAPGTRVTLQVRAYNEPQSRWGQWCTQTSLATLPSVISFTMVGETCFEVAWQRKPRTISAVDDHIPVDQDPLAPSEAVMYILRINEHFDDGRSVPLEKYHFTDQDQPFFLVEGLKPNHKYSAQLCTADANQVWSPWSAPAEVRMMPPLKVTVAEIGEDYTRIQWERDWGEGSQHRDADTDAGTKYRIAATALALDENGGLTAGAKLKYLVEGGSDHTLRHLAPDTSYRISISAYPNKTNVWGVWSDAVYLRTNGSVAVELDAVGEDYAHVTWKRSPPSSQLAMLHPNCRVTHVGEQGGVNPTAERLEEIAMRYAERVADHNATHTTVESVEGSEDPRAAAAATPGSGAGGGDGEFVVEEKQYALHVADATITEFNVKVFHVTRDPESRDVQKALAFESFLPFHDTTLRIPNLVPNTYYEVVACASNRRGEWGVTSVPLPLRTTLPTEMIVSDITHSCIRIKWGRGMATMRSKAANDGMGLVAGGGNDEEAPESEKYLIKIVGPDDDFCKEATLPGHQTEYDIQCLSINSCYSVSVKSLNDGTWGYWSNPIYVAIRAVPVRLVESSQDWLKLNWHNNAIPDGRQRELFITLIGDGKATTRQLPSGADSEYVFTDLNPLTVYSVHLLCVEQVPGYIKQGGWRGRDEGGLPISGRPTDTGITIALPLTAADYSSFYTDACSFSTLANIAMEAISVGENFVALYWSREVTANPSELQRERETEYEIQASAIGSDADPALAQTLTKVKGNETTITELAFGTLFEFRVRKVSMLPSAWSKAVAVQTLDKVHVSIGPAGVSGDLDSQIGVGEDFILLSWERGVGKALSHTSFVVKCDAVDNAGNVMGETQEHATKDTQHKLSNLQPDMRYRIMVKSIIDDDGHLRHGEWSDPSIVCTLSPMSVRVSCITEETAEVRWCRQGEKHEDVLTVHTIGSYHLRVYSVPNNEDEAPKIVEERQLLESDPEFAARCIRLTSFKPNHTYTAMVRASTENSWGDWSDGITFSTLPLLLLEVNLVGEECAFISWHRQHQKDKKKRKSVKEIESQNAVELAEMDECELSISTVGKDRVQYTKKLPASPSHYRLDGLATNMQYSFCLRPRYKSGAHGLWCEETYVCTLSPIIVEVSRIGETFVHVKWSRAPQQRIAARLREQHAHQQKQFEQQQRQLQNSIDAVRQELDDDGAFESQFLAEQGAAAQAPPAAAIAPDATTLNKLERMLQVQQQQQQKQQQLAKLQELQLLELERVTKYADGEDIRYEVVITGIDHTDKETPPADDSSASAEGGEEAQKPPAAKDRPFTFRRRINCKEGGEDQGRSCKMDGLKPLSRYTVTVRAMYNNGYNVLQLVPEDQVKKEGGGRLDERDRQEAADQLLWGAWSSKAELCTLKQISLCIRGIGSTHSVVEWDTGYSVGDAATAISQYQLMVAERVGKRKGKVCQDIIIDKPEQLSYTITGLQVHKEYTVTVRVCYDDERWGLWSNAIAFLTLPALSARVTDVTETGVSVLVWREAQRSDKDSQLLIWRPKQSELQLSINDMPSPSTFKIDLDTSTLLTLDDLTIDSLYKVKARENDANGEWREWLPVVEFETLPAAPTKPTLEERRGNVISLAWSQRRNREDVSYLYRVEMAYTTGGTKTKAGSTSDHGPFQPVGLLRSTCLRLELTEPVHRCLFRTKVCKEHQQLEGGTEDGGDGYLWSQYSPVAHFHAPSVPQPPTCLKIVNLRDTSAIVKWKKPENFRSHMNLIYKVYLSASYSEKPMCLGSTSKCFYKMDDLLPNTHYRVGCTAESSMGVSQNNHVLHFSTRVKSDQGPLHGPMDNPTSSTLPPRSGLRLPGPELDRLGTSGQGNKSPSATSGYHSGFNSAAPSPMSNTDPYSTTVDAATRRIKTHNAMTPMSNATAHSVSPTPRFLPPVNAPSAAVQGQGPV